MAKKAPAHHGGAWKVAYADFVTAMMALFMVLWISAQDEDILIATSEYFQKPFQTPMDATSGVLPFNSKKSSTSSGKESGADKKEDRNSDIQVTFLNSVAAEFYRLLQIDQDLESKPLDVQITSDGLRVILYDRTKRPIFNRDSAELTEWGNFVLQNLAWIVDRHKFLVTVDGHARITPTAKRPGFGSWELSAGRANAARDRLEHYAVDPALIDRITGFGETRPLDGEPPASEAHQRITLNLTLAGMKSPAKKEGTLVETPVAPAAKPIPTS